MHYTDPTPEMEVADQAEFDATVQRDGKIVLEWLAGVGIFAALLISILALVKGSQHNTITLTSGVAPAASSSPAAASAQLPPETVSLKVIPEGIRGPDGKLHDYFTKTNFTVKVGQRLDLVIDNTDEAPHSITSPQIGVNIVVNHGVHTYELIVHEKGRFSWFCLIPCDSAANGWAMQHAGYMGGFITAT